MVRRGRAYLDDASNASFYRLIRVGIVLNGTMILGAWFGYVAVALFLLLDVLLNPTDYRLPWNRGVTRRLAVFVILVAAVPLTDWLVG